MSEETTKIISLSLLSAVMLVLSYFFAKVPNSGSVPTILLFAGLLLAAILVIMALANSKK